MSFVTVGTRVVVSAMAVATFASDSMVRERQAQRLIGLMQLARESIMRQRDVELVIDPATRRTRLLFRRACRHHPARSDLRIRRQLPAVPGMGDTPDRFGDGGDIDFGGAARLLFISTARSSTRTICR